MRRRAFTLSSVSCASKRLSHEAGARFQVRSRAPGSSGEKTARLSTHEAAGPRGVSVAFSKSLPNAAGRLSLHADTVFHIELEECQRFTPTRGAFHDGAYASRSGRVARLPRPHHRSAAPRLEIDLHRG